MAERAHDSLHEHLLDTGRGRHQMLLAQSIRALNKLENNAPA